MNLLRRVRYYKRENDYLRIRKNYRKAAKSTFNFRTATKEEMAEIRRKVILNQRREDIQVWFGFILLLAALLYFIYRLFKIYS